MKQFRIQLLIAFVVFLCGSALIGAIYILSTKDVSMAKPGQVVSVSRPSPVAKPSLPNRLALRSKLIHHVHSSYTTHTTANTPNAPMQSVRGKGLYTTSSAQVTTVGGGGNASMPFTISHSSSRQALNQQVVMPTTNFLALASTRSVAAPGATDAPQMASLASAPRRAPGPPVITGPLEEENQLVEHPQPVGKSWIMLLLVAAYACLLARKKQLKCSEK